MTDTLARPPFDPELDAALTLMGGFPALTVEMIPAMRSQPMTPGQDPQELLRARGFVTRDVTIPGYEDDGIVVSVIHKRDRAGTGPGMYHTHGGGMIVGDRWGGVTMLLDAVERTNGVIVTVEYRLAPEFPDPYPVEDCYAGLVWTGDHVEELGIDPSRLFIAGGSAGGGLAAGTALLARDRGGPALAAQMLFCPMLDDRDATSSTQQIDGVGVWDRASNIVGWTALLGDRRGTDDVSIYAAPARATDLSGLPPAYIDCGSAEVFRDEDVAYATRLWEAGVQAELHVWAGGFHGFEAFAPHAAVSQAAAAARESWLSRVLGA
ncbi:MULTISPECIES: alpha/beta hydrolase [unclassified Microbacterium]|uniref:alpha/beta hydrolase n=1 Tax=unclassified Microbacterium TaxID=2609290 RepID=UPI00214B02DD|nr:MULTISPECIES: alpha/beta hydrolase [unclassified Microbacterium]MCR2811283.1 alpha/beta hydrolase [Microbacterium sp. zg.B185]WIM19441.1 alpha/beta hydrolase [Microbacterium sp. zg-B185]